jgi:hypothetical protein
MAVVFKTFDQIEIDGIASGNIVDVISNHAPKRLQVLEAYKVFTDKLNADHATALATAQTDLAITTSQLDAVTEAKSALDLKVATLTNEKESLTSQVAMLEAVVEAHKQKIAELEQYRPYNPRWLDGVAFYNRVSKHDMVTLLASDDPMLVTVGKTIEAYRVNHWPVVLDSQDFQNLVGYVLQSGVFDEAEVTEIMRDATREEAYRVPE